MRFTADDIRRDYPHRLASMGDTCPVCCGDRCTTDSGYGGDRLDIGQTPSPVFECLACPVWAARDSEPSRPYDRR